MARRAIAKLAKARWARGETVDDFKHISRVRVRVSDGWVRFMAGVT